MHVLSLTLILLFAVNVGGAAPADFTRLSSEASALKVLYDPATDLVMIDAREAPLGEVLKEVSKKTHLKIRSWKGEFLDDRITIDVQQIPLEHALKRLLADFNSAFFYSTSTATPRLVEIVLISKKEAGISSAARPLREEPRPGGQPDPNLKPAVGQGEELIQALVKKDSVASKGIIEGLKKSGEETKGAAIQALLETLKDRTFPAHRDVLDAVKELSADMAADVLTNWLQGDDPQVAMIAALALGHLADERTVDALSSALTATDPRIRQAAATSLVQIGGDRAIAALVDHLHDPDVETRRAVIAAISRSDDPRAGEALSSVVLHETDLEGRKLAAFYLVERQGERAIGPLTTALRDGDTHVRLFAVAFLGRLGRPAEPLLTQALGDPAPEVRATAAAWLDSLRKNANNQGIGR